METIIEAPFHLLEKAFASLEVRLEKLGAGMEHIAFAIDQRYPKLNNHLGTILSLPLLIYFFPILLIFYPIYVAIYNVYFHPLSKYPGPKLAAATKLPIAYYNWVGLYSHWLRDLHEEYRTDMVRISPDELSIITPEAWKDIYAHQKGRLPFPKDLTIYTGFQNLVNANDEDHRRIRRLVSHAFTDKALRDQEPLLKSHINKLLRNMSAEIDEGNDQGKGRLNMTDHYMFLIFDIISDLSFGSSFNCQDTAAYHPWVSKLLENLRLVIYHSVILRFPPLQKLLALVIPKRSIEARINHMKWSAEQVDKRLNMETSRPDFHTYIVKHNEDPEDGGMTREEIHNNAALFLTAGSETTAALVTAVTFLMLAHPQYHKRLVDEIRSAFPTLESITLSKITGNLPFLEAVVEETFRIYPPGLAGQPRISPPGGAYVAGRYVPEGTSVQLNLFASNLSSLNFEEPEKFVPERWLDQGRRDKDRLDSVNSFGVGSRNCLGKNLAMAEIRLVLTHVFWSFDLHRTDEIDMDWLQQKAWMTWEKKPLMVGVTEREGARGL